MWDVNNGAESGTPKVDGTERNKKTCRKIVLNHLREEGTRNNRHDLSSGILSSPLLSRDNQRNYFCLHGAGETRQGWLACLDK